MIEKAITNTEIVTRSVRLGNAEGEVVQELTKGKLFRCLPPRYLSLLTELKSECEGYQK